MGAAGAPLGAQRAQGLDLILSPEARRAFDLSLEPSRVRDRYGRFRTVIFITRRMR